MIKECRVSLGMVGGDNHAPKSDESDDKEGDFARQQVLQLFWGKVREDGPNLLLQFLPT